jgi:hypothetical protein
MVNVRTDLCQYRLYGFKLDGVSADHNGDSSGTRSLDASTDRRIYQVHSMGKQLLGHGTGCQGVAATLVDHNGSRF